MDSAYKPLCSIKIQRFFISVILLVNCNRMMFVLGAPSSVTNTEMTLLLNSLLKGYSKYIRPGFGGPPTEVLTNILIRSMGPVSEELMMFSMDCYFRQSWRDSRLSFKPQNNISELRPSIKMLNQIWKPDTFFLNGQDSYLHTITYQNKLFRINKDGDILYSQRLTIKSSCPMVLKKYPLDSQECPLYFGSYGYPPVDVQYRWSDPLNPIKKHQDIAMAQFKLTDISHGNGTAGMSHGNRSFLCVFFKMKREIGYYLLQIYLPCYLIVIISWVSFWINREATPARVMLGITTLLTTCTISITGREGIPKVSYSTALDIYLLMCFTFVFAALVEYAGVNYFTKSGNIENPVDDDEDDSTDLKKPLLATPTGEGGSLKQTVATDINGHTLISVGSTYTQDSCWVMFINCLKGNSKYRYIKALNKSGNLSVSKIDSISRIVFPFSFICLNILYWAGFMYYF